MNMYRIGKLNEFGDQASFRISENVQNELKSDFEKLRKLAIEMVCNTLLESFYSENLIKFITKDLFKPSYLFYIINGFQILALHLLGFYILNKFGCGILPVIMAFLCHAISQVSFKI